MSDIALNCPHCGKSLLVDEEGAGMTFNCPDCSGELTVPELAESVVPPIVPTDKNNFSSARSLKVSEIAKIAAVETAGNSSRVSAPKPAHLTSITAATKPDHDSFVTSHKKRLIQVSIGLVAAALMVPVCISVVSHFSKEHDRNARGERWGEAIRQLGTNSINPIELVTIERVTMFPRKYVEMPLLTFSGCSITPNADKFGELFRVDVRSRDGKRVWHADDPCFKMTESMARGLLDNAEYFGLKADHYFLCNLACVVLSEHEIAICGIDILSGDGEVSKRIRHSWEK